MVRKKWNDGNTNHLRYSLHNKIRTLKKYSVTLLEHVRWTYEVEANNEKEAVDIACEMGTDKADRDGRYDGYEIELIEDGVDEEQLRDDFRDWLESIVHHRFSY